MEVKLLGALDYKKVGKVLEEKIPDKEKRDEILEEIKQIERARRSEIVSSAGRLSRAVGNVMDIVGLSESKTLDQNVNFASRVMSMGHDSISDHDYCIFALQDVSPIVEQTLIEQRFASFTIKSRREVDFSNVGFVVPDFCDSTGKPLPNSEKLKSIYCEHMQMLFDCYDMLNRIGIPKEDARFVLPYCYHSNIIMGLDAHALKDLIVKLTKKAPYAGMTELRELGENLYNIASKNMPYIIPEIDKEPLETIDPVESYLESTTQKENYKTLDRPELLNHSCNEVDDSIVISALMNRYQYTQEQAERVYQATLQEHPDFKEKLIKKIAFESDGGELSQVNFQFQIPISLAILTHLARHRTHHIMPTKFVPNVDLEQYKTPPTINKNEKAKEIFDRAFSLNKKMYDIFKNAGVREEDLAYFSLSGNTVNALTNMDGKTLKHILGLRECTKAQWETRQMANGLHNEIRNLPGAECFESVLGPTCTTQGFCKEGKESCGKVYTLQKDTKK